MCATAIERRGDGRAGGDPKSPTDEARPGPGTCSLDVTRSFATPFQRIP